MTPMMVGPVALVITALPDEPLFSIITSVCLRLRRDPVKFRPA
jgi:hypothetical protein